MPADEPRHPVLQYLDRVRATASGAGVADAELLRRFAAVRDQAAFELIVWRHGAMVLRVCRGILRDAAAAEDAFQATFLTLACKAAAIARYPAPASWLYRVASHLALKALTSRVRREKREAARGPGAVPPAAADVAEMAELAAILHEEVNRLAARYRTPIVLCYLEGKTHEEAARALGWPKGTVSGRLARARDLLKRRLTRRGVVFPAAVLAALAGATADAAVTADLVTATSGAAVGFIVDGAATAVASAAASHLAKGVIRTMFMAKLKAAGLVCLMAGVVVAGASVMAGGGGRGGQPEPVPGDTPPDVQAPRSRPAAVGTVRAPSGRADVEDQILAAQRRLESMNNLKQIDLAQHNYHDVNGHFANNLTDNQGTKLLSWRVAILPYLNEAALFNQFKLNEPWDSPHNKKLLGRMPKVFRLPTQAENATGTFYQGFAGPGTMFDPAGPVRISDVVDGTSNTIFIVEAGSAVPWTKPEDLPYDPAKPLPKLGDASSPVFRAALVDGSVHTLQRDFKESAMRVAIVRNDGIPLDWDGLRENPVRAGFGKRVVAPGAAAGDLKGLKGENAKLQAALRAADAELTQARADLAFLRELALPRTEATRLAAQNAALADAVARKRAELQEIREQIERVKKTIIDGENRSTEK
jgi:RNA polymerase sigma factor (sigma-70 family)